MSNKIIIELQSKDSATGQITSSVREMQVSLKNLEGSGSSAFGAIDSGLSGNVASITKWVAGLGAAALAVQGLKTAFSAGIKAAEDFNQKTISIGATLTNLAEGGQGSFKNIFERNLSFARAMYEELRKEDANRASSLEDMMTTYNQLVQKGYAARIDEAKYIGIVTDKIKLATAGQETSVQINQEIRALLNGQADAHATIAQELKSRLGPAWAEIVDQHRKSGDLLKWMSELWPGIEAATEHTQNTLEAQTTALQGNLKYVGREGLAGAYEDNVNIIKQMNLYLQQHGEQLSKDIATAYEGIRGAVLAIPGALRAATEAAVGFGKELNSIAQNPVIMAFLGAAAGSRFGPWGALAGGAAGGFSAAGNIRQGAVDRAYQGEFGGYEVPMSEQTRTWLSPAGQTKVKEVVDKFNGMNKEFMERFKAMADAYRQMTGKEIEVTDAFRTFAQQADLYRRKPGLAARPGTSLHEKGLAMDINTAQANELARLGLLETYGFHRPMLGGRGRKNEPMHLQMIDFAAQAKQADYVASAKIAAEDKYQKYLDKMRKDDLKTAGKDAADAAAMAEKMHDDGLKSYLEMINNRKKLDRDAKDWTVNALQTVMQDEKMSYGERLEAAKSFHDLRLAMLDEEIAKLQETFGGRLPADVLEKYQKAMSNKIGRDIERTTEDQAFSWESTWKRAAENVQDAMSGMFESVFTGKKGDIGKQFGQGMAKMLSNQLTQGVMGGIQKMGSVVRGIAQPGSRSQGAGGPLDSLATAGDNLNFAALQSIAAAGSLGISAIGLATGSEELMMAATALAAVASIMQMVSSAASSFGGMAGAAGGAGGGILSGLFQGATAALSFLHGGGIVAHGGLMVAHAGLSLGSDERLIKAQTDEWILRRSATRALAAQGVSFHDLNSGRVPGGGGATAINYTYAPTLNHRMTQSDYNRDAKKMWDAHERERKRRGR